MKPLHTSWKQRKSTSRAAVSTPPRKTSASQIKARLRKHATSTPCQAAPLESGLSPITHASTAASREEEGEDPLHLGHWGLPAEVVAGYARRGVQRMFPWQLECLRTGNVLAGAGNLVYSAPTSAGKTLVAEILMLKRILETRTKAFLVLPFVSLAREKELVLAELFGGCGVRVGGFLGQRRPPGGLSAVDLAVCTIERANNLLNGMLLDQGTLGELGILVVDELHLVGDAHRGYLLELMLTKVAYAQKRGLVGPRGIQVVAMSATLANLSALAKWLSADLYQTDFRPVPLRQLFKLGQHLCEGPDLRPVQRLPASASDDPEGLLALCLETWAEGHALLVFCPTRRWCEALAASLARTVQQLVTGTHNPGDPRQELAEKLRSQTCTATGQRLLEQLRSTPGAMDPALASCLSAQVAFHHAGLTMEERDLLESAFREGTIRALVATTTLSSGVNLPARRVIIRSANFQGRPIDSLSYHQMVGRAGRMGLDTQGESILMCRDVDRPLAQRLSRAEAQPITSCLSGSSTSLRRALLEVVASGVANKPEELCLYTQCTLRHQLCSGDGAKEDLDGALQFLVDHQLVHLQGEDGDRRYCPSQLGRAVLASGLSPDDALAMVGELERARRCLALDSDLHLVYLVTPGHLGTQLGSLDWGRYQELWERLSAAQRRVAALVGVDEACMARAAAGRAPPPGRLLDGCRRFYLALALERLASERPLAEVARIFACPRGLLQSLQQGAATFAGMVCVLCQRLGWRHLQLLVSEFQARLHFGVQPELCPLLALPSLDGPLARVVFDAGFADPTALAQVAPQELDITLRNTGPFQGRGESRCWQLSVHGTVTTTQLADILVREARAVVEGSLGAAVAWADKVAVANGSASVKKSQADGTEKDEELQETMRPNIRAGTQIGNLSSTSQGSGPLQDATENGASVRSQNSSPSTCRVVSTSQTVPAFTPQQATCTRHGDVESPSALSPPKEAAAVDSELIAQGQDNALDVQPSMSVPWSSLRPGGTIAVLELEVHDSEDEERLTLDRLFGSLPIASPSSPVEVRQASADSPSLARTVVESNLDDAILFWENNSSPLSSPTVEQDSKEVRTLPGTNKPRGASPKDDDCYMLSGSLMANTQRLNAEKENFPSPFKNGTRCKARVLSPQVRVSNKNNAQKTTDADRKTLPLTALPNSRVLRSQARGSRQNQEKIQHDSSPHQRGLSAMSDSFDCGSSFFQDMVVPRTSKLKSPPLTLLKSRRGDRSSKFTSQATAPSPRRDSYRLSGSFVLDSQTIKAMDGVTLAEGIVENAADDAHDCYVANGTSDDDPLGPAHPKPLLTDTSSIEISGGICSLGSSTLSELFSSPGNVVLKSENSSPDSERSGRSSKSSKGRKRSASEGELFSSTEDSSVHSLDSLADRVREEFAWEHVKSARDFVCQWEKQKEFAMALVVKSHMEVQPSIGLTRSTRVIAKSSKNPFVVDSKCAMGVAVCWGKYQAHYLQLDGVAPAQIDQLSHLLAAAKRVVVPNVLEALRFLARPCGLDPSRLTWEEPRLANWLLDPNQGEATFANMVDQWAPHLQPLLEGVNNSSDILEEAAARLSVLVWHLQKPLVSALKRANMYSLYKEQEVQLLGVLSKMDLNGIGYDPVCAQQTVAQVDGALEALQREAWVLAGRQFALSSARQVEATMKAKVAPLVKGALPPGALSSRAALTQLSTVHPLPAKVLDWKKLRGVVALNLRPLSLHQRRLQPSGGRLSRIRPWSQPWTATGRVMVTEPNLQGIFKSFTVCTESPVSISVRAAFRPFPGAVLLTADYSQLELRLLAHLSQDTQLCKVFHAGGDVFRRMAALWSRCEEEAVDASLRQKTKQICYGITYGQGARSLAQQLGVQHSEAEAMIAQFRQAFPGMQRYADQLLERARVTNEVRTLLGRRRPLVDLHCGSSKDRAKAERQVLSTAVQGSAADLLRRALLSLDGALVRRFPDSRGLLPEEPPTHGAFLVLQMHDELLLEVCEADLDTVSSMVRKSMEEAAKLSVPLVVRLRAGPDWAHLDEV